MKEKAFRDGCWLIFLKIAQSNIKMFPLSATKLEYKTLEKLFERLKKIDWHLSKRVL